MQITILKNTIGSDSVNSVNARDIHTYLDVKTKFTDWIQRAIKKYDFIENIDYSSLLKNGKQTIGRGGHNQIDYIVTLDMAKELSMLENNKKGKETRKYFINIEKEMNQPLTYEQTMQNALLLADSKVKALETKIIEDKPLTDFGKAISNTEACISVGNFAKVIESETNKKFGRNKMFKWLRENKYLTLKNLPMQNFLEMGLFTVVETLIENGKYSKLQTTTLVTGKGQKYLYDKIEKS